MSIIRCLRGNWKRRDNLSWYALIAGNFLNDVHAFDAPASVVWPKGGGAATFINVYDWDALVIPAGIVVALPSTLEICVDVYPCALSIIGSQGSSVLREGNATISCHTSNGCSGLLLDSVAFNCTGDAAKPVIRMAGGTLNVKGSRFADCVSASDGAAIQSFAADVVVEDSDFRNLESMGDGGAISVVGGLLEVSRSHFIGCTASGRGGAISAAPFQCSGATNLTLTTVDVSDSRFDECTAGISGGALLAYGAAVTVEVSESNFSRCETPGYGGGIIALDGALTKMKGGSLFGNVAGVGGGAISASDAQVELWGVLGTRNTAKDGGGGVLFWMGSYPALVIDGCGPGYSSESTSSCVFQDCMPRCKQCEVGKYQSMLAATVCTPCPPGTYSSSFGATGSSECISCDAGKYSTALGAGNVTDCMQCTPGLFAAAAGASSCQLCTQGLFVGVMGAQQCKACPPGYFNNVTGATVSQSCEVCPAGTYSMQTASACLSCSAGTYSSAAGATGPTACIACSEGLYQPVVGANSSAACIACPAGTFSLPKRYTYDISTMSWDDAQANCIAAGGYLAPMKTPIERDQAMAVLPFGLDWWIGLRFDPLTQCWNWTDGEGADLSGGWGPANPKQLPSHHACGVVSSYQSTSGDAADINSQWPYFAAEFDLLLSNESYSSNVGNYYNIDCADRAHWTNGHVCAFTGASACIACNAGQYAPHQAATACIDCPAGTYASDSGAEECDPCPGANTSASTCNISVTPSGSSTGNRTILHANYVTEANLKRLRKQQVYYHQK